MLQGGAVSAMSLAVRCYRGRSAMQDEGQPPNLCRYVADTKALAAASLCTSLWPSREGLQAYRAARARSMVLGQELQDVLY